MTLGQVHSAKHGDETQPLHALYTPLHDLVRDALKANKLSAPLTELYEAPEHQINVHLMFAQFIYV